MKGKENKKWYKIHDSFVNALDDFLNEIQISKGILPVWIKSKHLTENSYNKMLAAHLNGECLDRDIVHMNVQKLELCDVFVMAEKAFYHVKDTWGSKSSYLFLQGTTSLQYYLNDFDFRKECVR